MARLAQSSHRRRLHGAACTLVFRFTTISLTLISFTAIADRGIAGACEMFSPEETARLAAGAAAPGVIPTPAMTTEELASLLLKAGLPQAAVVAALPGTIEERSYDFLNGGTYLRATLEGPRGTEVMQFVRQGKRLIAIAPGRAGRERVAGDLELSVRSADAAQRYVQWLLDVTREGGFWLVGSADEVPLIRATRTQTDLKTQLGAVRQDLEGKVQAPHTEESGPVFVVHQDAVVSRDLVRYTVKVSKLGLATFETATIARDLPVVYVATAK